MEEEQQDFTSAAELFAALGTQDALERRKVLGWVAGHPAEAMALGPHGGRDIVDLLLGLVNRELPYGMWEDLAIAIGAFDAPRVTEFFIGVLAEAEEPEPAYDAAAQLARRDREPVRDRLVAIVVAGGPPERIAAAAQLLVDAELPTRAAVIVAAVEEERPAPALEPDALAAWIEVLRGPFASSARERLEDQGAPALGALAGLWESLDEVDRAWLAGWAARESPALGAQLAGLLPAEEPEQNAAEALRRDLEAGEAEPAAVAVHLRSDSEALRAAARDVLVALGERSVEVLRPLVGAPEEEVRAAAVRALLDLGDDEWLAAELLGPEAPPSG